MPHAQILLAVLSAPVTLVTLETDSIALMSMSVPKTHVPSMPHAPTMTEATAVPATLASPGTVSTAPMSTSASTTHATATHRALITTV